MTTTKPRATRAADKAAQQPQPEPTPEDKAKAQEQAEKLAELADHIEQVKGTQPEEPTEAPPQSTKVKPQPEPEPEPEPEPTPEPEAKPVATFELNPVPVTYYRPSVRVGNDTYNCPHTAYGHEAEKPAMACVRKLAAEAGAKLAK